MSVIRGVLLAGGFRTHVQLCAMTADDQRNTLIVQMNHFSNQSIAHFQSLNDNDLAGAGAIMVFHLVTLSRTAVQLKTMSTDDQRNTLIVGLSHMEISIQTLQGFSSVNLVLLALGNSHPGNFNQPSFIQGVLLAGKFRNFADVLKMSPDDQRNTLIVALSQFNKQHIPNFQALNDFDLAGAAAAMVFLRVGGIRNDADLKTMTMDDQRNTTIVEIERQTHLGIPKLQSLRTMDLVAGALGVLPSFPVPKKPGPFKFTINSIAAHVQKSDHNHSDSDWLTLNISIGNSATKAQPLVLPAKTFHVEGAIKSGNVLVGPFKSDAFVAEDTDVVIINYVVTNLGSSRAEDQGKEAIQITNKVVDIAAPIVGAAIGTIFGGDPAAGFQVGEQAAKTFDSAISTLSDVFDFLHIHLGPPNCNGVVFSDTLFFLPGELAKAVGTASSRNYTGPQQNSRCGDAPQSTITFSITRIPADGLVSPDF